jgi:hypothetical protein
VILHAPHGDDALPQQRGGPRAHGPGRNPSRWHCVGRRSPSGLVGRIARRLPTGFRHYPPPRRKRRTDPWLHGVRAMIHDRDACAVGIVNRHDRLRSSNEPSPRSPRIHRRAARCWAARPGLPPDAQRASERSRRHYAPYQPRAGPHPIHSEFSRSAATPSAFPSRAHRSRAPAIPSGAWFLASPTRIVTP